MSRAPRSAPQPLTRRAAASGRRANSCAQLFLLSLLLLACLQTPARAQAPPPPPAPGGAKGSITGRVVAEGGQPLASATVVSFRRGAGARGFSVDVATDAEGKFALNNLEDGAYTITAVAPAYVPEEEVMIDPARRRYYYPGDAVTLRMVKGGVITGRVTNADGEPLVNVYVNAVRLRTPDGKPAPGDTGEFSFRTPRFTDDRGVYRLYGLQPGAYVVYAGGKFPYTFQSTPYDGEAPTYHPSASSDAALEVNVQASQEVTDVDIRHRGEPGHVVSGTLAGALPSGQPGVAFVTLRHRATGVPAGVAFVQPDSAARAFSFEGVADGDYDLTAQASSAGEEQVGAPALRVSVRGADVTGLRLTLTPLGSLAGRLRVEQAQPGAVKVGCAPRTPRAQQVLVYAWRDEVRAVTDLQRRPDAAPLEATPDANGDFTLRGFQAARYRLGVRLPDEDLYLRSLAMSPAATPTAPSRTTPAQSQTPAQTQTPSQAQARSQQTPGQPPAQPSSAARGPLDPARQGISFAPGERAGGLSVVVAGGAASLRGRVAPAAEGATLPDALRVHLIPTERERAEDVLRYGEAFVQPDGTFALTSLAPGRYWLLARPAAEADARDVFPRPLTWDARARAELRRDAEAAGAAVELAPCQRAADLTVRYGAKQ